MPDRRRDQGDLYAVVAEFDRPDALLDAVKRTRAEGFSRVEAFSPFPVDGLAEALDFKDHAIAPSFLLGGIGGLVTGFGMQVYTTLDFPLNVGGRPLVAWPAFTLIGYELMVLGAVSVGILAMLLLNRLPRLHHPLFEIPSFHLATSDKFFLAVLADDPAFDPVKVRRWLSSLHPLRVDDAPFAETAR